jgi:HSP20 family molecular chaperone IbpA
MLVRTRPSRPSVAFGSFDRSFDRAFEQLTSSFFTSAPRTPVVDAAWRDGDLVLTVDLPGVSAEQVGVSVSGRTLTLSATTEHSSWERSVSIGSALDPEQVSATHVDGRLTVTIGASAKPAARTIEIATTVPAIEAATDSAEEPVAEDQPEIDTSDNA